jgi:hypothetical protein
MPDAVLARCGDLLVDGQRVAVLGPIALDVTYDSRFQTDAYDAGLRTWTVQMDVLDVRAVGDDVPDMAWVHRIVGVVSALGTARYLRYVLSAQTGRSERK